MTVARASAIGKSVGYCESKRNISVKQVPFPWHVDACRRRYSRRKLFIQSVERSRSRQSADHRSERYSIEEMVWGLFPLESQPGAQSYYIFSRGAYKVGRKDCDVIIQTDRAVSRVHAEIIIDEMQPVDPSYNKSYSIRQCARIRDLSKFGTFINKESGSQPVNALPKKEAFLKDGDFLSFGTGNATFGIHFVPLIAYADSILLEVNPSLEEAMSSVGSVITRQYTPQCTHIIVGETTQVTGDLISAVIEQKPLILGSWFTNLAKEKICTEIPSFTDHLPNLMLDGMSVKVVGPDARVNCLKGYTFVLMEANLYKFGNQIALLIHLVAGNVHQVSDFPSCIQDLAEGENRKMVIVIPEGSNKAFRDLNHFTSLARIRETKLVAAILSGNLELSVFEPQSYAAVCVSSSQSTDETIIAESDLENDTAASIHLADATKVDVNESEDGRINGQKLDTSAGTDFRSSKVNLDKDDMPETGTYDKSDIIYSQALIVRDVVVSDSVSYLPEQKLVNFKRFKKREVISGNTYRNLIPFSNKPYHEFDYENRDVAQYMNEEKILKQREAIAEDLFNTEKATKRGASSLRSSLARR